MALPKMKNSSDDFAPTDTPAAPVQGFDEPRRKVPRFLKLMVGTAVGLVIVGGGVSLLASQLLDQAKYKKLAVEKVAEATGYTIDWQGDIALSLLPLPHASVHDLVVKSGAQQILSIKKAEVSVALAPLLSKKIEVKNVTLDEPVVTLVTTKDGHQTWMTNKIQQSESTTAQSAESKPAEGASTAPEITLNSVEITNGNFVWDDQSSGQKQAIEGLNLRVHADDLKGPFDVKGDLTWSGKKVELSATTGQVDMDAGQYPVQVKMALPEQNVASEFSGVVGTKNGTMANGDLTLDVKDLGGTIKAMTGKPADLPKGLDGKMSLAGKIVYGPDKSAIENMTLALGQLAYAGEASVVTTGDKTPPKLSFNLTPTSKVAGNAEPIVRLLNDLAISVKGTVNGDLVQIDESRIKAQGNDISVVGKINTAKSIPNVDLSVKASSIDVDDIKRRLGVQSNAPATGGKSPSGSASVAPAGFELPFQGHIKANVDKLTSGGQIYSDISADMNAQGQALDITAFSAILPANTSVNVKGRVGNTTNLSDLSISTNVKTSNFEKLLDIYQVTLPDMSQKIDAASLDGRFSGNLKNLAFGATVNALSFTVSGEGTVQDPMGQMAVEGLVFSVKHPNITDAVKVLQPDDSGIPGLSGPLNLSGNLAWTATQYHIKDLKGMLGQTSVNGNIDADVTSKPSVSGDLNFGNLVFESSAPAPSSSKSAGVAASPSNGGARWSREAIDTAWMNDFNANLKVKAQSITQGMWKLSNANLSFALQDGTLNIEDLSANMFGGQAAINGTVKSGKAERDPLTVNTNLTASNVDARGFMSAVMGAPNDTVSGTLNNMKVTLSATGLSPAALVQTLGGQGDMTGQHIVVKGVDAAQLAMAAKGSYKPLERAGSLFGSFGQGQTEFTTFNSAFIIENGIVNFTQIFFDGPKATLNSKGQVNLPLWTVNLTNSMTVKNTDIPPFDFTIKGSLDNPTKTGGDVINNYLKQKLQGEVSDLLEKAITKKLGGGTAPATGGTTGGGQQINPDEAVKALQGLFGH